MEGKVLAQAFEGQVDIDFIETWEKEESAVKYAQNLGSDESEVMQQLVELGYIEAVDQENKEAVKKQWDENLFYLARSYAEGARFVEASELLEKLCNEHPENYRYRSSLIRCYSKLGYSDAGLAQLKRLDEKHRLSPDMRLMEGELLILQGKGPQAKLIFDQVKAELGADSGMEMRLGEAYLKLDRWGLALELFEIVLKSNPDSYDALHGKGLCLMRLGTLEAALDALLASIGILYFNPSAHFHLGECLALMEAYVEAAQALEMTLKLAPGMSSARELLIEIHEQHLSNPERLKELQTELEETERPLRVIVSGLPRSGTSMMMQMLEAGGIAPFTDAKRASDEDNPKGYYEHESIKRLAREQTAIDLAGDKAIKVISQLLTYLPPRYNYKVIFMHRPLGEVIRSQEKMLQRKGRLNKDATVMHLGDKYEQSIQSARLWAASRPYVDFIEIPYVEAIEHTEKIAAAVADFLDMPLSIKKMMEVVEKKLHRNKI
jgi:tetratricopeptide (TPR) repeat protein